jgi:hypothetical protein
MFFGAQDYGWRVKWNSTQVLKELKTKVGRLEFRLAEIDQENVGPGKNFLHAFDVARAFASKRKALAQSPAECCA